MRLTKAMQKVPRIVAGETTGFFQGTAISWVFMEEGENIS